MSGDPEENHRYRLYVTHASEVSIVGGVYWRGDDLGDKVLGERIIYWLKRKKSDWENYHPDPDIPMDNTSLLETIKVQEANEKGEWKDIRDYSSFYEGSVFDCLVTAFNAGFLP